MRFILSGPEQLRELTMKNEIPLRIIDTSRSGHCPFFRNSNIGLGLLRASFTFLSRVDGRVFPTSVFTQFLKPTFSAMPTSRIHLPQKSLFKSRGAAVRQIQLFRVSRCYPISMHSERSQKPQRDPEGESTPSPQKRIQTQIHRRQKAKAVSPLEDEWNDQSDTPPNLRTPSSEMKKP